MANPSPYPFDLADLRALLPWVTSEEARRDRDTAHFSGTMRRLKEARIGALRLPRERGGAGLSLIQLLSFVIELAAADPNVAHAFRNHAVLLETFLLDRARVPVFDTYLDRVASGQTFGVSATELGRKNVGDLRYETSVRRSAAGVRLNGTKFYSTGNLYADYLYVHAVDENGEPIQVVIPATRAGVHIADDWDGFGQPFTASGTTSYANVAVEPEDIVDKSQLTTLPYFGTLPQLYLSAVVAGILQRIVTDAATLLKSRERNFYHAVAQVPADDPLLQTVIGRLESVAHLARVGTLEAAGWLETALTQAAVGQPSKLAFNEAAASTAKTKVVIDELALRAAGELFEVGSASATSNAKRLDRHWRALRTVTAHNPIVYKALAIGKHVTHGEPLPNLSYF